MFRPACFAGSWYPATEHACRDELEDYAAEGSIEPGSIVWRGVIAPHAGFTYSRQAAALVSHYLNHNIQPSSSFVGYAGIVL